MSFVLPILLFALLFFLHLREAERVARLEARLGALQAELHALRSPRDAAQPQVEAAAPEAQPELGERLGGLFEGLVGGRLLIWIGGIALAAAGIFLIRHSIALVTPEARMIGAAGFGLLLIGLGEYARAGRLLADDPRIGQSLVGAGLAILYATAYGSYLLFGLIGSGTASSLMLAITAVALGLSLRHGAPTALMGLVGGFLTPLLVGDPSAGAVPVLLYFALLDVAVFAIAWRRRWPWLAAAAVAASFAWTGYFLVQSPADALAAGLFAALLAIAASLARPAEGRQLALIQPAIIGLAQLAFLAARADVGLLGWLLFGALAAASLVLSLYRAEHRFAPAAALLFALLLIAFKASVGNDPLVPFVAAITTLLFAVGSLPLARRGDPLAAITVCAGLAGPLLILRVLRPELAERAAWGGMAFGLALAALAFLWLRGAARAQGKGPGIGAFGAAGTATLLLAFAAYDLVPRDFVSAAWLAAAIALLLAGVRMPEKSLRLAGLLLLTATIVRVFLIDAADLEGVLRILSFLALGGVLIWIGRFYPRVLRAERKSGGRAPQPGEPAV